MIELVRAEGLGGRRGADDAEDARAGRADEAGRTSRSELRTIMEACPPQTIEHALAAMRDRPDRTGDLPSIAVPTLIIVGDADAITPPAMAEAMHKSDPEVAARRSIQGAGHMSPMEQPEQVNRAIAIRFSELRLTSDRMLRAA